MLQVVGLGDDSPSVTIRYKLLSRAARAKHVAKSYFDSLMLGEARRRHLCRPFLSHSTARERSILLTSWRNYTKRSRIQRALAK